MVEDTMLHMYTCSAGIALRRVYRVNAPEWFARSKWLRCCPCSRVAISSDPFTYASMRRASTYLKDATKSKNTSKSKVLEEEQKAYHEQQRHKWK